MPSEGIRISKPYSAPGPGRGPAQDPPSPSMIW